MTDEQFAALAPYEANYKTAIELNFSRYPGAVAIDTMYNIYRALTDSRAPINKACSVCILHLVQKVGKLYFAEKARREALKTAEPEPKPDKAKKTSKKAKQ